MPLTRFIYLQYILSYKNLTFLIHTILKLENRPNYVLDE